MGRIRGENLQVYGEVMTMGTLLAGIIVLALGAGTAGAQVVLVQDGQPQATIVLPQEASDTLKLAAEELQTHIQLIAGAQLPVVEEGQTTEGALILVGPTQMTSDMDLPLTDLDIGFDGYVIRTGEDKLALCGRTDQGTLNAVYGFLEDYVGVRWYYPGPYGTDTAPQPAITLGPISEVNKPRFKVRKPWYNSTCTNGWTEEEKEAYGVWSRRNRCGGISGYVGHHWRYSVPPDRYFDEHPEYFAEIQGERRPSQLCTSNEEVIELYTQDILSRFKADPSFMYASMSPNDGAGWCECEKCQAVSSDLTSRILTFINQVAHNVAQEFPDRYVAFYAYSSIVNPPRDNIECEPNVMPWVTHYSICQMHPLGDPRCPYQANFRRIIEGWRAISEQLGIREYASWWPVPCCESRRIAMDTRYYASLGATAMSREYLEVQYGTPLLLWVESKLLWNPDRDLSELLDDFFGRFYGSAGVEMRKVYDSLADRQATAAPYDSNWTGNTFEAPRIYPREMLVAAVQRVEEIAASMEEGSYRERVAREGVALAHAVQFLDTWAADRAYAHSGSEEDRRAAIEQLQAAVALRDAMPDNFMVSTAIRNWAARQLKLYTTDRTRITEAGQWNLHDDYNTGGMVKQDAEEFSGLYLSTWGLGLQRGREGYVQYHFVAEGDLRFTEAELYRLLMTGGDGIRNRIEIQKDGGEWQVFSEDIAYTVTDHVYSLSDYIAGAKEFRLRLWGKNESDGDILLLDNFGIRGRAE